MGVFGATGDLTKCLVIPALYNLSRTIVPLEHFALIGVARAEGTTESWRDQLYDTLKGLVLNATTEFDFEQIDEAAWKRLAEKMVYVRGDLNKQDDKLRDDKLRSAPEESDKARGAQGNAIFCLAVADRLFGAAARQGGTHRSGRGRERQVSVLASRCRDARTSASAPLGVVPVRRCSEKRIS
jgi:glucose-6-phosphate 1-dehydrogenase